mgnify:CR=1 FL=1
MYTIAGITDGKLKTCFKRFIKVRRSPIPRDPNKRPIVKTIAEEAIVIFDQSGK